MGGPPMLDVRATETGSGVVGETRTTTDRNAVTTPYIWPSNCVTTGWLKDFSHRGPGDSNTTITETVRFLASAPKWHACLPAQDGEVVEVLWGGSTTTRDWDRTASYSKAVCPQGWAAMHVGTSSGRTFVSEGTSYLDYLAVMSTAKCCMSGDIVYTTNTVSYLDSPWLSVSSYCLRADIGSTTLLLKGGSLHHTTSTDIHTPVRYTQEAPSGSWYTVAGEPETMELVLAELSSYTQTWSTGKFFYPHWSVVWRERDREALSPRPPVLTSGMLIPVWTEGMTWEEGRFDNGGKGRTTTVERMASATTKGAAGAAAHPAETSQVQGGEMMTSQLPAQSSVDNLKEVEVETVTTTDGTALLVSVILAGFCIVFILGGAWVLWRKRKTNRIGMKEGGHELEARGERGRYLRIPGEEEEEGMR